MFLSFIPCPIMGTVGIVARPLDVFYTSYVLTIIRDTTMLLYDPKEILSRTSVFQRDQELLLSMLPLPHYYQFQNR